MISSHSLRGICVAFLLGCFSVHAQAIPKAAEHEDAPVTTAADIARPKPSAKPSTKTVAPKKAAKKSVHKAGKSKKASQKVVASGKSKHRKK